MIKIKDIIINIPPKEEIHKNGFNMNIKINPKQTVESLMEYGFTNHHESTLYYSRNICENISFNLSVNKETLEIERLDVLDEDWLQPYDYQYILLDNPKAEFARNVYFKVNKILTKLQNDGIITGFTVGMYI